MRLDYVRDVARNGVAARTTVVPARVEAKPHASLCGHEEAVMECLWAEAGKGRVLLVGPRAEPVLRSSCVCAVSLGWVPKQNRDRRRALPGQGRPSSGNRLQRSSR